MSRSVWPFLLSVLQALLAVAGMTWLLVLARQWLNTPTVALFYLLPVGVSTALWGLTSGITAAIAAFFAFNYFFLPPYNTLLVFAPQEILDLAVFLVVAVTISQLLGRAQASLATAQAREREARHLYDLSTALLGQLQMEDIARTIADRVLLSLPGVEVGVRIDPGKEWTRTESILPPDAGERLRRPNISVPIQGMRGLLGEIAVASPRGVREEERRLLHTYSLAASLAIERALLAAADNRARLLSQSDAFKSALLSSVSHELRSPLATIKASVTSLLGGEVEWNSEARRDLLAAVDEETDHLNLLVGNLLDMTRIEAGFLQPKRNWNVLAEIVQSVTERMRNSLSGHQLQLDVSEELPLVPVDYIQIEQVFANLISNSDKYSAPGTPIHIRAWAVDTTRLQVRVENEGPGVAADDLERIFDKFHRVTSSEQITGTGLGLSICKGIVEAHGGQIWAENTPRGMAFNFTLPLTWDGAAPPLAERP